MNPVFAAIPLLLASPQITSRSDQLVDCAGGISDQAGGPCLQGSSTPTFGWFLPYPGVDNTFTPPAAVAAGYNNNASGTYSFVGGGTLHLARGGYSVIGGGAVNNASASFTTISGGQDNRASGPHSTVGGGASNIASGETSTVVGGAANIAAGLSAIVLGGGGNEALGQYSSAGGLFARAHHDGAFVWADSTFSFFDKNSSTNDEFNVYADGGVRMFAEGDSTSTPSLVVAPDGRVGIGTSTPTAELQVAGTIRATGGYTVFNPNDLGVSAALSWFNDVARIRIGGSGTGSQNGFDIQTTSDVSLMRLLHNGNVGIGDTTPSEKLDVAGSVRCVSLIQTSDARFKREVRDLEGALEAVLALRGVSYEWDPESFPEGGAGRQLGFLAQEVRLVVPEAVQETEDGILSVAYSALVPVLVEALRDLERENGALRLECQGLRLEGQKLERDSLARHERQDLELAVVRTELRRLEQILLGADPRLGQPAPSYGLASSAESER